MPSGSGKYLTKWFGIAVGIAIAFLCLLCLNLHTDRVPWGHSVEPLAVSEKNAGDRCVYEAYLPNAFDKKQTILFKTTHTRVSVKISGMEIYRYGFDESSPSFLKSPGTYWHLFQIPKQSAGDVLTLEISSVYRNFYGNLPLISYGNREGCILNLILQTFPIIMIDVIILFTGIVCLILHIIVRIREDWASAENFLYVGAFSLLIAIWSVCQSGFLQGILPNGKILYFLDFFSFYLFPVPFNLYLYSLFNGPYKKGFFRFGTAYLINMSMTLLIQLSGWKDMFELISVTHLLMLGNSMYIFHAVSAESRQDQMMRRLKYPIYVVMLFAVMELTMYYIRGLRETSIFLPFGTLVFILTLILLQVEKYYQSRYEKNRLRDLEKLANEDVLTGAHNRNAYENRISQVLCGNEKTRFYGSVMFDVNDMKEINDRFGHEIGDEALKNCYRCAEHVFGAYGTGYRIGGDEFIFLISKKIAFPEKMAQFDKKVEETARSVEYPFSVAAGYSCFEPGTDRDIRNMTRRSDTVMYANKAERKRKAQG